MDLTVIGLKNCDTCRAARKALDAAGHTVTFRDVRENPLTEDEIRGVLDRFGPALVNTRSTTWRGLDDAARKEAPEGLLAAHPALMKRPVIQGPGGPWLGWGADVKAALGVQAT